MEIKLSAAPAFYVIYLMVLNQNSDSVPLCFIRLSVFSPNHPVNHARIGLNDFHNLGRHVFFNIIRHRYAVVAVFVYINRSGNGLHQ